MSRFGVQRNVTNRAFLHCAEELLQHTSRYYIYAEQFLAELTSQQDFSMVGYDSRMLSEQQRTALRHMLNGVPTPELGRDIIEIVSSAIKGERQVAPRLLEQYVPSQPAHKCRWICCPVRGQGIRFIQGVSPVGPIQNIATRLGMPVEVVGKEVRISHKQLVRYLDSPNPTVRQNLQDSILWLHEGGYKLVNTPSVSGNHNDWKRKSRPMRHWRQLSQWLQHWRQKAHLA